MPTRACNQRNTPKTAPALPLLAGVGSAHFERAAEHALHSD